MTHDYDYVIETRTLSKCYGRKLALDQLDLRVPRGGIHAIVGANGAGKSTLFRILLGFLPPSAGEAHPRSVPGLLEAQRLDGLHHYLVLDQDADFEHFLRAAGARTVQSMPVSLDRAVNAFLAKHHAVPAAA